MLGPEERLIPEEALFSKALANTVTTRDFTDLIVRLKSGSLDLSLSLIHIYSRGPFLVKVYPFKKQECLGCNPGSL